jgi:hypothetical protein
MVAGATRSNEQARSSRFISGAGVVNCRLLRIPTRLIRSAVSRWLLLHITLLLAVAIPVVCDFCQNIDGDFPPGMAMSDYPVTRKL